MALKSNREGLRKESVDYLGNLIIDEKLKQNIINSINDVYVNESDVLSLEEIQASSDLSGKIADASSIKTLSNINNLFVRTTNENSGKENIIANCKYISSISEANKPRMYVIYNTSKAIVIGYTYEKSENTPFAQYIYYAIGVSNLYLVNCANGNWVVHVLTGSVL